MSKKDKDKDVINIFSAMYPDMDGNGKVDLIDAIIYDDMRRKVKLQRYNEDDEDLDEESEEDLEYDEDFDENYDEESDDYEEDVDYNDNNGDDNDDEEIEDNDDFEDDFDEESCEEENNEYVTKERNGFISRVKKYEAEHVKVALGNITPFDTGKEYEAEDGALRYLLKHADYICDITDFKRALFERFPHLTDSFDYEDSENASDIIDEYLRYDTAKGVAMWEYLLELFPHEILNAMQEEQIVESVALDIDYDEVQDLDALVKFFERDKNKKRLFEDYVWDRKDDYVIKNIFGCLVKAGKYDTLIEIFEKVEKTNGGFTKTTLEKLLDYILCCFYDIHPIPENVVNFITEKANLLGIRSKKILKSLAESLEED